MKTFIKKFLCFVLAAIMVAGLFPVTANAAAALVISSPDNWEHVSKSDPPNLKWNKISGAPGYLVTVKNDATGEYYTEREKTTKNSYSLENLFDDELGSSEYPRLKIWVGALNSDGTDSNSQDIIYVIVSEYPDVTFNSCSSVTSDGATLKMTINKDYGSPIEDCGFYIGTSSSVSSMKKYSFADYGSYDATTKGTKIMTVTGLNPNTKYYVRAYAENGVGEEYTGTKTFTTKEAEGFLSLSKTSINWEYDFENEETVTVNCSGSYYVDDVYYELSSASLNKDHDYEWLDVDELGNSITIRPTRPNYSKYARTAEITVTSGSQSKDIFVKQAACEESAPTMTLKRGNTVLTDGMNLGAFTVGQPVMEAAIVSNNVRKVSAQLRPKTSTATDALDYSTKLDFISLDISDLPAGDYKVTVYASNSDTANDYWSQSPFSDGSMEFYFSLVDKNSGGGNDGGDNSDFPKSYSEAENMVIFSENKVPQNVKKGKIRHIPQVKSADPKFCDEYWIGYDENGNEYNTVSGAIRYCTRSVYSMVLSYFGIDCTPGKMAALMKTSGEIDGNNYDQVTTILKKTYNNLSYANKGDLHDLFENYANDKSFSPVYVYFGPHDYNGKHSTGHAVLVIGRDPSNPNKYYCVEPDYGTGGNITTMVVNDSATKTTEYTWASCRGREILYCYQWKYSGSNDEETNTYTITYNANGGSGAPSAQTKTENKALTLSTTKPTRSGYTFDGWATSASASTAQYQPGGSYTANANVTLYAVWKTKEHTYVEEVTDPTCTEKGYITYTCSECGYSYVGNYVNATGHDYCSWYRTADPTCTEKGSEQRDCYNCYHYETREVNANGHDYRSEKVTPTCSEKGYTLHTCYDCGESYVDSYVDMAAHVFCDWYRTADPTCTEKGSEQRGCYNCYHYETRKVNATGHNFNEWEVITEATYIRKGEERRYCKKCSYYESREIPVLEKDGTYTVSYNANGGSGAPSAQTKTENKALTLSTTKPTRSGYEFLGWAASANAGTAQYQPGASYTANANVTLYAVWKQKEVIPADAPTIIIGEVSGRAGETVEVPVYVKNNPNMAVIGFDIEYDDEYIKLTDYKNSGLSDWLIGIGEGEKANWINEKGSSFNGEMLVLVFEVKEGIKEAEAEILFTNIKSGNVDGEKINFIIENGKIVISSGKPGDSNNDGEVDVFDLLVLRKHLAGMSTTINTGASDVNSDGEVDVFDLLMLRKYLAGMKVELL